MAAATAAPAALGAEEVGRAWPGLASQRDEAAARWHGPRGQRRGVAGVACGPAMRLATGRSVAAAWRGEAEQGSRPVQREREEEKRVAAQLAVGKERKAVAMAFIARR